MNPNGTSQFATTDEEEELALALALSASLAEGAGAPGNVHKAQSPPSRKPALRNAPAPVPHINHTPINYHPPTYPPRPPHNAVSSHPPPSNQYGIPPYPPALAAPPKSSRPFPTLPSLPNFLSLPNFPNLAASAGTCAGCARPIFGTHISALGSKWHSECLKCGCCGEPISVEGNLEFVTHSDNKLYHVDCHKLCFHPSCAVCGTFIPQRADGKIEYSVNPFWREKYCPGHQSDNTPKCCSCSRLQQHDQEWVQLQDGRHLCLLCTGSIVVDTADAQPLYLQVLTFYRDLGMAHPDKVPLMLVDSEALNDYSNREGRGQTDGPVFHVRGLTLSEMYRSIPSLVRTASGAYDVDRQATAVQRAHCNVTAILVIYGMPRLLTGAIIAHELMHAWLRMKGVVGLDLQVEEGLCQLMALLWLDRERELLGQAGGGNEEAEVRLGACFGYQIREDSSPTYGGGFRMAFDCYQNFGLQATVDHVLSTGRLPL